MIKEIRFIDICAGLGGFHAALHKAEHFFDDYPDKDKIPEQFKFKCVMACDINDPLREVYPKNFPELEKTYLEEYPLKFVSQHKEFQDLYEPRNDLKPISNKNIRLKRIHGDLELFLTKGEDSYQLKKWNSSSKNTFILPEHDLLCAGFPCQPFSKSGKQRGFEDVKGNVFDMIVAILKERKPKYLLLENVTNIETHDEGNTLKHITEVLTNLGYDIKHTTHYKTGDDNNGHLSPLLFGFPQYRERFFLVGRLKDKPEDENVYKECYPFPFSFNLLQQSTFVANMKKKASENLNNTLCQSSIEDIDKAEVRMVHQKCIQSWLEFCSMINDAEESTDPELYKFKQIQSPLWGYELHPLHWYPNPKDDENTSPKQDIEIGTYASKSISVIRKELLQDFLHNVKSEIENFYHNDLGNKNKNLEKFARIQKKLEKELEEDISSVEESCTKEEKEKELIKWIESKKWPSYAAERDKWPRWKYSHVENSRQFAVKMWAHLDLDRLQRFLADLYKQSASHQKLEWNLARTDGLFLEQRILQFRPSGLRVTKKEVLPTLVTIQTQIPVVYSESIKKWRYLLPTENLVFQGFEQNWKLPPKKNQAYAALGNAIHVDVVKALVLTWLFSYHDPDGLYDVPQNYTKNLFASFNSSGHEIGEDILIKNFLMGVCL